MRATLLKTTGLAVVLGQARTLMPAQTPLDFVIRDGKQHTYTCSFRNGRKVEMIDNRIIAINGVSTG